MRSPAEPVQAKHARVELIAKENAATPGAQLLLGVHFILEPGWHIYWLNPGDSGQPPSFQWQLPSGFTAGDVEWPRPERLQSSSQIVDYGYHDNVLLMVPVRVPGAISGPTVALSVDAKWLVCREVCLPDHARLQLSLPAGAPKGDNPDAAAIFASAQKLTPKPLPPGWEATAKSGKDSFVLSLASKRMPSGNPQFFPLAPGQIENAAPQAVQSVPDGKNITLKKSDLLVKPIRVLRGVLVFSNGESYQVAAPISGSKGIK